MAKLDEAFLDEIFPRKRADEFFDAIYGGAEDGAYDIILRSLSESPDEANLEFRLIRRPNQCLKCSLTYGLPDVFKRHPVIDLRGVAEAVAKKMNWQGDIAWEVMPVVEKSEDEHVIPFNVRRA